MAGPFKMRSGNSTPFKMMGSSSPVKQTTDPVPSDSTSTKLTLKEEIAIENAKLAEERKKKKQKNVSEGDILDFYKLGYLNKEQRNTKLKDFGYEIPDDK